MCPSYLATRDEKDSTRGRSRVLQEAIDGSLVQGLADPAVAEALDLCLACKGCASDCPTGVDMATYKAEALHQKHDVQGVRRPRSHRLLGRLPAWADRAAPVAPLANRMMRLGPVARLAKATAGIDQRRSIPAFAPKTLRRSVREDRDGRRPDVWIWADSFSDHFFPANGHAAIRYLESVGLTARVIPDDACCGLTWITTGQLDQARAIMARTVGHARAVRRVGRARHRPGAVLPGHAAQRRRRAHRQHRSTCSASPSSSSASSCRCPTSPGSRWSPSRTATTTPSSAGPPTRRCSSAPARRSPGSPAAAAWPATSAWRRATTRSRSRSPRPTCCLPCARNPDAVVLADGMSCRVQLDDLAGVPALHLAELLGSGPAGSDRRTRSPRSPRRPSRSPRAGVRRRRRGSR